MRAVRLMLSMLLAVGVVAASPTSAQALQGRILRTLNTGASPVRAVVIAQTGGVFVGNTDGTLTLYGSEGDTVIASHADLGEIRDMIEYSDDDGSVVLVLSANPSRLTAFDLFTGARKWSQGLAGSDPTSILYDFQRGRWLVADRASGDLITPTGRVHVGGHPIALAGPGTYNTIYVLSPDELVTVDSITLEPRAPLSLPGTATDIAWGYPGPWITTQEGDLLGVSESGDAVTSTYRVGGQLTGVDLLYQFTIAYVLDAAGSQVTLVDVSDGAVVGSVPFPTVPSGLAKKWDEHQMYVVSEAGHAVYDTEIRLTRHPGAPVNPMATCTVDAKGTHLRLTWDPPRVLPEGPITGYKVRIRIDGKQPGRWLGAGASPYVTDWSIRYPRGTVFRITLMATSYAGRSKYARTSCTVGS